MSPVERRKRRRPERGGLREPTSGLTWRPALPLVEDGSSTRASTPATAPVRTAAASSTTRSACSLANLSTTGYDNSGGNVTPAGACWNARYTRQFLQQDR
ncbi:MAG: hypothetical protein MZV70_29705 [Desulfobacterales bacterium]|nr:hypothetical protein [Desulfobacterales bacterium]